MRRSHAAVIMLVSALASFEVSAAPCDPGKSPFTDVGDGAIFCTEALWLRNALVTFGCGNGTTYCPNDNVTRAQMALFMNRLYTNTIPDMVFQEGTTFAGDLDTGAPVCQFDGYSLPADRPGRLLTHALGLLSLRTDGAADLDLNVEMNVDGGPYASITTGAKVVHVPANQWTDATIMGANGIFGGTAGAGRLEPGKTYGFRVLLRRLAGATTGELTDIRCQLKVDLPVDPEML